MTSGLQYQFSDLDPKTRDEIKERTDRIRGLMQRTLQDIIEIGKELLEVKQRLPHGQFGDYLRVEFDWSWQTANNFMNTASQFGNGEIENGLEIAPKALYILSSKSVPEKARKEAVKQAQMGEKITPDKAKRIKTIESLPEEPEQPTEATQTGEVELFVYEGKEPVWGRINGDYGYLQPGTKVKIANVSLTSRDQCFVRIADDPTSVIQVEKADLVAADQQPAPDIGDEADGQDRGRSIPVGTFVCLASRLSDVLAEKNLMSDHIGKVIAHDPFTVQWNHGTVGMPNPGDIAALPQNWQFTPEDELMGELVEAVVEEDQDSILENPLLSIAKDILGNNYSINGTEKRRICLLPDCKVSLYAFLEKAWRNGAIYEAIIFCPPAIMRQHAFLSLVNAACGCSWVVHPNGSHVMAMLYFGNNLDAVSSACNERRYPVFEVMG
ncbi:MAG: DUF3102 domain-containing protein [Jaaginema sp. PMC 1079.18]|nr:DUF3102 domain-containing protein [Jaaginema sp. PMC 1080.18]MEC4850111.1 DUF3102 domain-containing protein [Jaaginema sp. PMC 1079.18]MEC4864801.1 DUF3102 domain-containing protein [Jaaginema sp. PMC 1078.18]